MKNNERRFKYGTTVRAKRKTRGTAMQMTLAAEKYVPNATDHRQKTEKNSSDQKL